MIESQQRNVKHKLAKLPSLFLSENVLNYNISTTIFYVAYRTLLVMFCVLKFYFVDYNGIFTSFQPTCCLVWPPHHGMGIQCCMCMPCVFREQILICNAPVLLLQGWDCSIGTSLGCLEGRQDDRGKNCLLC